MRSAVQQVTVGAVEDAWSALSHQPNLSAILETHVKALETAARGRSQPKRYDRLLPVYCLDLLSVFANLAMALAPRALTVLTVGDSCPYGVRLNVPDLVVRIAEAVGFEYVSSSTIGTRGHKWRGLESRHQQILEDRMLVLRSPRH